MKDFLIVYSSKTGNTEKVAKKFYEVAGERCDLAAVKQVPAVDDYRLWIIKKSYFFKRWGQKLTLSTGSAH